MARQYELAREKETGDQRLGRLPSRKAAGTHRKAQQAPASTGCSLTATAPPRSPGTARGQTLAGTHLGLKSWKRPLRFMAKNFTAASSSSPLSRRRAACALQRAHGASVSRVPAAAAAATAAARRNLSHCPHLPSFRASVLQRPRMRPSPALSSPGQRSPRPLVAAQPGQERGEPTRRGPAGKRVERRAGTHTG